MASGGKDTEVQLDILRDTGVGGLQLWNPLKRAKICG